MDTANLPSEFFQRKFSTRAIIQDEIAAFKLKKAIRFNSCKDNVEPLRECAYNACALFEFAPQTTRINELGANAPTSPELEELIPNETDRVNLLCALSFAPTRDMIINCVIEHPYASHPILRAVACSTADSNIRANALVLWAIVAIDNGHIPQAKFALEQAHNDLPTHNLTNLMLRALEFAGTQAYMHSVRSGCKETWKKYAV